MGWLRLDDTFDSHPKVLQLSELMAWRWVRLLLYCARHETDGKVSAGALKEFRLERAKDELVALGLLDELGAGELFVHDYTRFNPTREEKERERERWAESKRQRRKGRNVHAGHSRESGVESAGESGVESSPLRASDVPYPYPKENKSLRTNEGPERIGELDVVAARELRGELLEAAGLPEAEVVAAREARQRSGWVENLSSYTGCRYVRGSHGVTAVHDVLGQEPAPVDWPHPRPTRAEVADALERRAELERAEIGAASNAD